MTEQLEPQLRSVWPMESRLHKRAYNLLREAYIKARYSREFTIEPEELAWLMERVTLLQALVNDLCQTRIAELKQERDAA